MAYARFRLRRHWKRLYKAALREWEKHPAEAVAAGIEFGERPCVVLDMDGYPANVYWLGPKSPMMVQLYEAAWGKIRD